MEGWVDLGHPAMHQSGVELAIFRSLVRRPTTTLPSQPVSTVTSSKSAYFCPKLKDKPKPVSLVSNNWLCTLWKTIQFLTSTSSFSKQIGSPDGTQTEGCMRRHHEVQLCNSTAGYLWVVADSASSLGYVVASLCIFCHANFWIKTCTDCEAPLA